MRERAEIKSLTGLRGVAAGYVVIHHFFLGIAFTNPLSTFLAHGYLAVDLFFVLSGFVMTLNYSHLFQSDFSRASLLKFLSRRIARVYPLYFVSTLCAFVLILVGWLGVPSGRSLGKTLVLNLAMVQAWGFGPSLDAPGWSISAEWAAYLLFPLLLAVAYFRRPVWGWVSLGMSVGMLSVLALIPSYLAHNAQPLAVLDLHDAYHGFPVWRCLPEFTLGILAAKIFDTPTARWLGCNRWAAYILCLGVPMLMTIPRADLAVVLLFPLVILCLAGGAHLPSRLLSSRPIHFLGVISYSIYLVHDLLGGLLGWMHGVVHSLGMAHAQTYAALIAITLTLPLSAMAYKMIEAPGRQVLRGLLEQRDLETLPPCAAQPAGSAS